SLRKSAAESGISSAIAAAGSLVAQEQALEAASGKEWIGTGEGQQPRHRIPGILPGESRESRGRSRQADRWRSRRPAESSDAPARLPSQHLVPFVQPDIWYQAWSLRPRAGSTPRKSLYGQDNRPVRQRVRLAGGTSQRLCPLGVRKA